MNRFENVFDSWFSILECRILILNEIQNPTCSKGSGNLCRLEIGERSSFRSDENRTLFLLNFKETGCQVPLELDTHHAKSTRSDFDFRRV